MLQLKLGKFLCSGNPPWREKAMQGALLTVCLFIFGSASASGNDYLGVIPDSRWQVQDFSGYKRYALVIGNADYANKPLVNPANDAADIAKALQNLQFDVQIEKNANKEHIINAVRKFSAQLEKEPNSVGFFFYAGHGIQRNGENYMLPLDNDISRESEIETRAYPLTELMNALYAAKNKLNIVVLDACRNDPFKHAFSRDSAVSGLGQVIAPAGTLIAYSTQPNNIAKDGGGNRNSPYTRNLLRSMQIPDLKLGDVFKHARIGVMADTAGTQVPWENSSVVGDFYFLGGSSPVTTVSPFAAKTVALNPASHNTLSENPASLNPEQYTDAQGGEQPIQNFVTVDKLTATALMIAILGMLVLSYRALKRSVPAESKRGQTSLSNALDAVITETVVKEIAVDHIKQLPPGTLFKIGRAADVDLHFNDSAVSALHAEIYFDRDAQQLVLRELSANGTWVNSERIGKDQKHCLHNGDRISFARKANLVRLV